MMYNKRWFFEYRLPVPYNGMSLLFERINDRGKYYYDSYIEVGVSMHRLDRVSCLPLSVDDALRDYIDWVEYFAERYKQNNPMGACTLAGKDFVFDEDDVADLMSEL